MKTYVHLWYYLAKHFLEFEMFQTNVVENKNTHFSLSSFYENRAIYDIMWKCFLEPDRLQMTNNTADDFSCYLTMATDTQSMQHFLFFLGKICYANAPHSFFYTYMACLF
jgi:hypothetical protein